MTRILLLTLIYALTASTAPAEARCARTWMGVYLLTPQDVELPADAALVAHTKNTRDKPEREGGNATAWTFELTRDGEKSIALKPERIAPGIITLPPESTPKTGEWTVSGLNAEAKVRFSDKAGLPAPPAAPELEKIEHHTGPPIGRGWRDTNTKAMLKTAVPEGVVAAVSSWNTTLSADEGSGWSVNTGDTQITLYEHWGHCGWNPDGQRPPKDTSADVAIVFVDAFGQLSSPSNTVSPAMVGDTSP